MHKVKSFFWLSVVGVLLAGCVDTDDMFQDKSVEEIYNMAMDRFEDKSYPKAAKAFAEVERQFPYSNWAVRAQIMSAYSYYEAGKYEEAIEGFNVFIQLHPGHAEVPYALYMTGLCYYEQIPIVERDQENSEKAQDKFKEIIDRFPDSAFARDAKLKIDLIRDHVAAKEMDVGRFYQKRGSYLAAVNRFQVVVKDYQTTNHAAEALFRLVECYNAMGIQDQAKAAAAVLGHNYANTLWYQEAYRLLGMSTSPAA